MRRVSCRWNRVSQSVPVRRWRQEGRSSGRGPYGLSTHKNLELVNRGLDPFNLTPSNDPLQNITKRIEVNSLSNRTVGGMQREANATKVIGDAAVGDATLTM